jgi:hypothetical protein
MISNYLRPDIKIMDDELNSKCKCKYPIYRGTYPYEYCAICNKDIDYEL